MRQDRSFHAGEAVSTKAFGALLSQHFDWLVTVDPHLHRIRSLSEIFRIPARAVHCAPLIAKWVSDNVKNPVFVGPDSESRQWVKEIAAQAAAPFVVLQKVRRGDREVEISVPDMHRWQDRTPVVLDDIIATGRTMMATLAQLQSAAMRAAACVGIHAVFTAGAFEGLQNCRPVQIVTTNTVRHFTNAIDVSQLLADATLEITN
jgi:ribose-phosphate pyrophosphokinase